MVSAVVLLAEGAEEMEATISIDVLRRAGIEVTVAGLSGSEPVVCSRQVKLVPDVALTDVSEKEFDIVLCPGGKGGATNLASSAVVGEMLKSQMKRKAFIKFIAAICAGPICLLAHGIGKGMKLTSHPSVKNELSDHYNYVEERVVRDGNLITSRGPGTAFEFALAIVEAAVGGDKVKEISAPMILN